jgi:DNA-binding HxlR family transcriptional regulator
MSEQRVVRMAGRLDPRSAWTAEACSIARALQVVSTRSALLILREAFYGTSRFEDFADRVGISQPVTAARLRDLVDAGLLVRTPYQEPGRRSRLGYELTEMGAELLPVLVSLMQWGDRWLAPQGAPVAMVHAECGQPVSAQLRCAAGHRPAIDELMLAAAADQQ